MVATEKISSGIDSREASAFMTNLTALVALWVLGFPLSPGAIRTMALSSILSGVAMAQFILRCLQTKGQRCGYTRNSCAGRKSLFQKIAKHSEHGSRSKED